MPRSPSKDEETRKDLCATMKQSEHAKYIRTSDLDGAQLRTGHKCGPSQVLIALILLVFILQGGPCKKGSCKEYEMAFQGRVRPQLPWPSGLGSQPQRGQAFSMAFASGQHIHLTASIHLGPLSGCSPSLADSRNLSTRCGRHCHCRHRRCCRCCRLEWANSCLCWCDNLLVSPSTRGCLWPLIPLS